MKPVLSIRVRRLSRFTTLIVALIASGCAATAPSIAPPAQAPPPAAAASVPASVSGLAHGTTDPAQPALPHAAKLLAQLRLTLRSSSGTDKERALNIIRDLQAVAMIPELIDAVDDPTPSPRDGDTGWGFTGHHAASILGEMAYVLDGVPIEKRGRDAFSFHDDMYRGGEALRAAGRLKQVRENWAAWWSEFRKR